MVGVFIWLPKWRDGQPDIGHGAMLFRGGYVSNWPGTDASILWGPGQPNENLAADVQSEGGLPQLIYLLKALDEDAMGEKWAEMRNDLKYSFLAHNCFTTVAEVLSVGLGPLQSAIAEIPVSHEAVISHSILINYIQQILLVTERRLDLYGETPQEALAAFLKELNAAKAKQQ